MNIQIPATVALKLNLATEETTEEMTFGRHFMCNNILVTDVWKEKLDFLYMAMRLRGEFYAAPTGELVEISNEEHAVLKRALEEYMGKAPMGLLVQLKDYFDAITYPEK